MSLGAGMLIFTAIAFFVTKDQQFFAIPGLEDPFLIAAPTVLIAGLAGGNFLYKKLITPASNNTSLKQKTSICFTSNIIRLALLEGSVLISVVAMLVSFNMFYLIFIGIGLLYYITLKPKEDKISRELNLTYDERHELGMKS